MKAAKLNNNLQFRDTLSTTAQENLPGGILVVGETGQIISFSQKRTSTLADVGYYWPMLNTVPR